MEVNSELGYDIVNIVRRKGLLGPKEKQRAGQHNEIYHEPLLQSIEMINHHIDSSSVPTYNRIELQSIGLKQQPSLRKGHEKNDTWSLYILISRSQAPYIQGAQYPWELPVPQGLLLR